MGDLKTDPNLLKALQDSARLSLGAAELRRQKVSFIMGSLGKDSTITRAKVEEVLRQLDGHAA
jgi:hypothetical protein